MAGKVISSLIIVLKSHTNTTPCLSRLLLCVSEFDVQLHYQPGSRMKLSDVLSRQSNHSTEAGNKTEIKGWNISIHEVDTDISEQKLNNIPEESCRSLVFSGTVHWFEGRQAFIHYCGLHQV